MLSKIIKSLEKTLYKDQCANRKFYIIFSNPVRKLLKFHLKNYYSEVKNGYRNKLLKLRGGKAFLNHKLL
jgi:hypothetical protein